jgi:uncharacterized membrane protein YheB (UPF0754 family)
MIIYLYLIPFLNALMVWMVITILINFLLKYVFPSKKELIYQKILQAMEKEWNRSGNPLLENIEKLDLEEELSPILDKRLDLLIDNLKLHIPMGGLLLAETLTSKVKHRIKMEILKALPEVKKSLRNKVQKEFNLLPFMEERIRSYDLKQIEKMIYQHGKQQILQLKGLGAVIGFIFGLIELVFMLIFF